MPLKTDESDISAQAHASAREQLRERAKCLAEMLSMPSTPSILIASEIGLVLKAGVECYGEDLINERMVFIEKCSTVPDKNGPRKFIQETNLSVTH